LIKGVYPVEAPDVYISIDIKGIRLNRSRSSNRILKEFNRFLKEIVNKVSRDIKPINP